MLAARRLQSYDTEVLMTTPATATADTLRPEDVWTADHDAVMGFARFLVGYGTLATPYDVLSFFEKPYKWSPEHARWVRAGRPEEEAAPDDLFETVGDDEGETDGGAT